MHETQVHIARELAPVLGFVPYLDIVADPDTPGRVRVVVLSHRVLRLVEGLIPHLPADVVVAAFADAAAETWWVGSILQLWAGSDHAHCILADQLLPGEDVRVLRTPLPGEVVPVAVGHDFGGLAPLQVGWLTWDPVHLGRSILETHRDLSLTIEEFSRQHEATVYTRSGKVPETGMDCSGFTYLYFREKHGIRLPRLARWQWQVTHPVEADDAQTDDLVFFLDDDVVAHVGIVWRTPDQVGDLRVAHCSANSNGIAVERLEMVAQQGRCVFGRLLPHR
jgi:hypothetical protein